MTTTLMSGAARADAVPPARVTLALIVEDNPGIAEAERRLLEGAGYTTELAGSVEAAQAAVRRRRFDIMLLDLSLPNGEGMVVIDKVCPLPQAAGVPFVVVTGHADDAMAVSAITRGAADVVYKGIPDFNRVLLRRVLFALYRDQRYRADGMAMDAELERRRDEARERERKRRDLNRLGWGCFWVGAIVMLANTAVDIARHERPSYSATTAGITFFCLTLAVALTQGVPVDKFIDSWGRARRNSGGKGR